MKTTPKITPFLWFNSNAEEAMNYYVSLFKDSKIISVSRYGEGAPFSKGTLMTGEFLLAGQKFLALNGGPQFKFTEAISFLVDCETQREIDEMWNKLSADGEESMCGWVKDKFGLWWQVVPPILGQLLSDKDGAKAGRVMQAMMKMKKIIIQDLVDAANSKHLL
jgi:predicted 3-demethylubiquinone-9 3-methyltransferase (glyoxalase superfamily)